MNVPKLRFKDFTDEWKNKKIKDFLLSHKGGAPLKPTDFVKNSGYEVIPKKAISSGGKLSLDLDAATFCSESFFKNNSRSVVDDSYLITTLRDLVPSGPSIGYIVRFKSNKSYLLAQGVYGIKIDNNLEEAFLIHYSNTDKYRVMMQTMMVGSTQVHIRNSDFFKTSIKVPSLPEQTKIANFLTAIDEKITQLAQKHDLLTQYKKGVMQQIFSQKLRFKDDDGREFSEWENKKIGDIFKFKQGIQCSIENQFMEMDDSRVRFIRIVDLTNYQEPRRYIENPGSNYLLKHDELFMVRYGSPGLVGYGLEGAIANNLFRIIAINKDIIFNKFYFYFFSFFKNKILQLSSSSTMPALNFDSLGMLEITLLSLPEQTKIANFLTAIDDKITHTQTQLDAVKLYKKGLLQQLFV